MFYNNDVNHLQKCEYIFFLLLEGNYWETDSRKTGEVDNLQKN